jgi:hypothetical protein
VQTVGERIPVTFDEYFLGFLEEHTQAGTRWSHFAMLHYAVIVGVAGMLRRRPLMVAAASIGAVIIDIGSHYAFESGYPGRSLAHPVWSARANFVLTQRMYQRRQSELDEMTPRASAASDAPAAAVA